MASARTLIGAQVRHPLRSGWLDEWGRLKDGHPLVSASRSSAPWLWIQNCPPLPSASSCSRMYGRTCSNSKPTVDTAYPRAQKCSPVKFRSLPHSRATAMALFPFRNPITEATGCLGESRCTYGRDPASDGHPRSGTPFAAPSHGRFLPNADASFQTAPCAVA